jgi:hypothetical protein
MATEYLVSNTVTRKGSSHAKYRPVFPRRNEFESIKLATMCGCPFRPRISDQTQPGGSRIYVIPIDGGEPKLVTEKAPFLLAWLVFISYTQEVAPGDHPANKYTMLRLMRAYGSGEIQVLAKLFGGQGTLNVPSWSPDSRRVSFVSYRLVP